MSLGRFIGLVKNGDDGDVNDNDNYCLVYIYFLDNVVCFIYIVINFFNNSVKMEFIYILIK